MDKVANLSPDQRRDLCRETATRRGINPAIIEKDFWVCWVLKRLFTDPTLQSRMVFKGGTTLSKVFGLINRFSEDIDLILDWRLLGYGPGHQDPFQDFDSGTQQDRFNKFINKRAAEYIADTLIHELNRVFAPYPEVHASVDAYDPQAVNVAYPTAFSETYLRPEVRLEIGPLASWVPSAPYSIQPYTAEEFPSVFEEPACPVVAISAERSFWEKATILHQQAHRTGAMPSRYSRHYYDLYKLSHSSIKNAALKDLELLSDVVSFKQRFYPCRWARYENAKPSSFRLVPGDERLSELGKDYRDMEVMIFEQAPGFDVIVAAVKDLENEINQLPIDS